MPTVQLDTISLNVIDEGAGQPILFVHGFPLDHRMWEEQRKQFATDYKVLIPDLRGFGQSKVTSGVVSMVQFADDLAELLNKLDIDGPVVFCGLSMGGYIGWEFARRHPDKLKALVICDSKALPDSDDTRKTRHHSAAELRSNGSANVIKAMIPKLFGNATQENQSQLIETIRQQMQETNPEGMAAALMGMADRADATTFLESIHAPSIMIVGQDDIISPVDEMQQIADTLPNSQFSIIEQAGHLAPIENPSQFNTVLQQFLTTI